MSQLEYIGEAGYDLSLTCFGMHMQEIDLVWGVVSVRNSTDLRYIYARKTLKQSLKYSVSNSQDREKLTSVLTIRSISPNDSLFHYQCSCNIYGLCGRAAASSIAQSIVTVKNADQLSLRLRTNQTLISFASKRNSSDAIKKKFRIESEHYAADLNKNLRIACDVENVPATSIVWLYCPIGSKFLMQQQFRLIYVNAEILNENLKQKFDIETIQRTFNRVATTLTIKKLEASDAAFTYVCACNFNTTCLGEPLRYAQTSIQVLGYKVARLGKTARMAKTTKHDDRIKGKSNRLFKRVILNSPYQNMEQELYIVCAIYIGIFIALFLAFRSLISSGLVRPQVNFDLVSQ